MRAILVTLEPLDPATETRPVLRFCNRDDDRVTGLDNQRWWPGVARVPSLKREAFNGNFDGSVSTAGASVTINMLALRKAEPDSPAYRWPGTRLTIWRGTVGDAFGSYEEIFTGLTESYKIDAGTMEITAKVDTEPFDADLLEDEYAGTGGKEGGEDLREKPKPMLLGRCLNVEGVLIDDVNNVYQVHAYGTINAIEMVFERAAEFGPSSGDHADYAALVAATIPEGQWATCLAEGMFRLGAPPYGVITADVQGHVGLSGYDPSTPGVIQDLCDIAGVDPAVIDSASLAAFAAAIPTGAAVSIGEMAIGYYLTSRTKLMELIQTLCLPCNAHAALSWLGKLQVTRFSGVGTPTMTFDAQGRELPPVLTNEEMTVGPPWWRIEMEAKRCWRVQSKDEIAVYGEAGLFMRAPSVPDIPTGTAEEMQAAGWSEEPPGFISPVDVDGVLTYGPIWFAGRYEDESFSTPVLQDSRFPGWSIATLPISGLNTDHALGATDAIKLSADYVADSNTFGFYYIPTAITGPCRLRCKVRGAADRIGIGFSHYDPGNPGNNINSMADLNSGIWIAQADNYVVSDSPGFTAVTGIYPFTNYEIDGNYLQASDNEIGAASSADAEYDLVWNGELLQIYVKGVLERSYFINPAWDGDRRWPCFVLWSPSAEIYDIVWGPATHARVVENGVVDAFGAMRRISDSTTPGWEVNAPNIVDGISVGYLLFEPFKGAGRIEATIGGTTGTPSFSYSLLQFFASSGGSMGVLFDADGTFEAFTHGSTVRATGTWVAGDTFAVRYTGKRCKVWKNGAMIVKKKVGKGKTVTGEIDFGGGGKLYNIKLTPDDEAEDVVKGSTNQAAFTSPIADTDQIVGGYAVVATTADLAYSTDADGDEVNVTATFNYTKTGGAAVDYTPDTKLQKSTDGGGSWSDVASVQTPSSPTPSTGTQQSLTEVISLSGISGSGNIRWRLLAKNLTAGAYTITASGSLYVEIVT